MIGTREGSVIDVFEDKLDVWVELFFDEELLFDDELLLDDELSFGDGEGESLEWDCRLLSSTVGGFLSSAVGDFLFPFFLIHFGNRNTHFLLGFFSFGGSTSCLLLELVELLCLEGSFLSDDDVCEVFVDFEGNLGTSTFSKLGFVEVDELLLDFPDIFDVFFDFDVDVPDVIEGIEAMLSSSPEELLPTEGGDDLECFDFDSLN